MPEDRAKTGEARLAKISKLLARPPSPDFHDLVPRLIELKRTINEEVIAQLEPALNAYLNVADSKSADAKKRLAEEISEHLGVLNLAVRCPITKQHSVLQVTLASYKNPNGRFSIQPRGMHRTTISRAKLSDLLPFELMEAQPRREPLSEWHERIKRPPGSARENAR